MAPDLETERQPPVRVVSPELRRRRHAVIFAGSFHGKTTAHRQGLGHDAEAPPPTDVQNYYEWQDAYDAFRVYEDAWKGERIPANLEARNNAFVEMCTHAYGSDLEIILSHYSEALEKAALAAGRDVRFVLIDYHELVRRVAEQEEEPPVFRVISSFGYASSLAFRYAQAGDDLIRRLFPTVGKAIASL